MMNNLDKFKEKLKKGKICFGAGVWFSDPLISELFSELGFDFLWIDWCKHQRVKLHLYRL